MRWKLSRPELTRPQNPYHQGFLCRLLTALLMVPERSSDDSLSASFLLLLVFIFSFPVGHGI
jgi:hypothetical protein